MNNLSFEDIRPDLKKYYKPELNDGKLMNEFSKNSNEKIIMCCDICNHEKTAHVYTFARTLKFNCDFCTSLGANNEKLVKQWHPIRNGDLTPFDVKLKSNKKYWWICEKGHEWEASPNNRHKSTGNGCKKCQTHIRTNNLKDVRIDLKKYYKPELNDGKLMNEFSYKGNKKIILSCDVCGCLQTTTPHQINNMIDFQCLRCNSIGTKFPHLINEWNPKNKLTPFDYAHASQKKIWWKCQYGHEWEAKIATRTYRNRNCPYCSNQKVNSENCLANLFPDIAREWHPTKNNEKTPFDVVAKSGKKYWWLGECGHEWETSIVHRTHNKSGCPICNISKGEKEISNYLKQLNINFEVQYFAKIKNKKRFFDIFIPSFNLFVEIHGLQHFENIDFFNRVSLQKQRLIDEEKRKYATKHGHYMMIDYREHDPRLALKRFKKQFLEFLKQINSREIAI